jgi:hypothetical protein
VDFRGALETHITLACDPAITVHTLKQHAARHNAKLVLIELARGQTPSQPMFTLHARATLPDALQTARRIQATLASAGLRVTRVKVEAPVANPGVPQTDAQAPPSQVPQYFEHHLKLLLPALSPRHVDDLTQLAQRHDAHLSRNALRTRTDSLSERFITQRCRGVGLLSANTALNALLNDLKIQGHIPIDIEQEYVVHDSNIALDHGWLTDAG